MRTSNHKTPSLISQRLEFDGSNFYAYYDYNGEYVIKSYNATLARVSKEGIVWITTRRWSQTTTRHMFYVQRGLSTEDVVWSSNYEDAKNTTKWRDLFLALA